MNIINIPYRNLVLVPLLLHKSHIVDTEKLREYKIAIASITAQQGKRISFETTNQAKEQFESTRCWFVNIESLENGETRYSLKENGFDSLKPELTCIDRETLDLLKVEEALEVFDRGSKKTLKNNEQN